MSLLKYSFFSLLTLLSLNGCSSIAYYSQAIGGQWEIYRRSRAIDSVLADPATPTALKQKLTDILKMRAFASKVLHLPDNRSYTYYADIKRPYVVWSVFAAPAFSLKPKLWCFPIIGCVSYRGYFSEAAAMALAKDLRTQGYDVYVAGIAAYSTLGWFSDPVLNTMLAWNKSSMAGLIFHELAHQKIYIKNDTAFNEGFATTVEYVGVERWLAQYGTQKYLVDYQQSRQRQVEFVNLVLAIRKDLQEIYQQKPSPKAKTAAFQKLRAEYAILKKRWGGYAGYDAWFANDLNNAKLLSVVTYQDYVPAFRALLEQLDGDLVAFYEKVAQLGELPVEERRDQLAMLGVGTRNRTLIW